MKCDFCGISREIEWWYPALDFDVDAIAFSENARKVHTERVLESTGEWGACWRCAPYIDRQDYFFLAIRITRENGTPDLFGPIHSLFNEFQRMRSGEKYKRQETML
jgi:hypothetical protein